MPRYWVIAPVESKPPELFDRVWQYDLVNNLISIGWKEAGDVSTMSREKLSEAVASAYPDKPQQTKALYGNMLWTFYHEIIPGDFIIARRGRKTIAAAGKVIQLAVYAAAKNPAIHHPSFLGVAWDEQPRNKRFDTIVFPMHTLTEIPEAQYRKFLEGPPDSVMQPPPEPEAVDPSAFVLEKVFGGLHRQQLRHDLRRKVADLQGF
jgi:hypothetical protein